MKHKILFSLLFVLVSLLPGWSQLTTMHATLSGIGIKSLNGLTAKTQTFATGTTGTDFNISSAGTVHTFNIPTASATNRGLLSTADWTAFNNAWSKSGNSGTTAGTNFLGTTDNVGLSFKTNNTEYLRITNTGNFGIGTTNPASKLHIAQSATVTANYGTISLGSGAFDGSTVGFFNGSALGTQFAINTSSGFLGDLINCQAGGVNKFIISASGTSFLGGAIQIAGSVNISGSNTLTVGTINTSGVTTNNGANTYFQSTGIITVTTPMYSYYAGKTFQPSASTGTYTGYEFGSTINQTGTATGIVRGFFVNPTLTSVYDFRGYGFASTFAPTSGSGTLTGFSFTPTINQTGGANGITRGIYINPTLTAAADFRAIDVTGGTINVSKTITTPGTTGAVTINKLAGTVNIAAAGTTVTVTNSLVTANSIIMCTVQTNDATALLKNVVPGAGSFVITLNAATTAETAIAFFVIN